MADEKLQYTVTFKTRSEGDGAQKATAAVRDLTRETDRLNAQDTPGRVRSTETAFHDLGAEVTKTTNTSAKAAKGFKMTNDQLMQLAYFADDAQYGLRGIGNNLPGLAAAFGAGGGLAAKVGLAATGIAVAIPLFQMLRKALEEPKESAEALADRLEKAKEGAVEYANAVVEALGRVNEAREEQARIAALGDDPDTAGRSAEDSAFAARQSNIEILITATNTLNQLMGRQVLASEAIAAAEEERNRRAREEQEHRIQLAQRESDDAAAAARTAEDELNTQRLNAEEARQRLKIEEERLGVIRRQVAEAKALVGIERPTFGGTLEERTKAAQDFYERQERAKAQLPQFESDILPAEEAVQRLKEKFESLQQSVSAAAGAAEEAAIEAERQNQATQEEIRTAIEQGQVRQAADSVKTAADAGEAIASSIRETIAIVEASGEDLSRVQSESLESLKDILSDGVVAQGEFGRALVALQTFQSNLVGDINRLMTVSEEGIKEINANDRRLLALENQMKDLRARVK